MTTRRKVAIPDLEEMVRIYAGKKEEESDIKKVVAEYNKKIKYEMTSRDIDKVIAGDITASLSIRPNEDFNELQAIEILRDTLPDEAFKKVVKTREYLDDDEFEKLVYNNEIDAAILNPCRTIKGPVVTLRLSKTKK